MIEEQVVFRTLHISSCRLLPATNNGKEKNRTISTVFLLHLLLSCSIAILIEVMGNKPRKKSTFCFKSQVSSMFRSDFLKIDILPVRIGYNEESCIFWKATCHYANKSTLDQCYFYTKIARITTTHLKDNSKHF